MSMIMTRAQLSQMARKATPETIVAYHPALVKEFTKNDITIDPRIAAIMASILNESGGLTVFEEFTYYNTSYSRVAQIFGHSAPPLSLFNEWKTLDQKSFDVNFFNWVYDDANRRPGYRLGNVNIGDGYKFRGMGIGQITGRGNFAWLSRELKMPELLDFPEMIKSPEFGALVFAHFWMKHGLNAATSDGSLEGFLYAMRRMNAGLSDFTPHISLWHMTTAVMANDDIPEYIVPTREDIMVKRTAVKDMQLRLWEKGYNPKGVDGFAGPGTMAAISTFEGAVGLKQDGLVDDTMLNALRKPFLGLRAGAIDKDSVKKLQSKIIELGGSVGDSGADGSFGFFTTTAVQKIQASAGKRATGIVDEFVMDRLKLAA